MSAYADRYKQKNEQLPLSIKVLDFMVDICPSVRDVLLGVFDDSGVELVKGASITIWAEGSRLKCVINVASGKEKGWLVISEPRYFWESLEKAIASEEVDWKESKPGQGDIAY